VRRPRTSIVEAAGLSVLEHRLLAAGFEFAIPGFDRGIDVFAYREKPFQAFPIQLKAARNEGIGIDRKYAKRGLHLAYVVNALSQNPVVYVLPYDDAERIIAGPHLDTMSWRVRGLWRYSKPTKRLISELLPYQNAENWFD
jgi:hypothetical protein